MYIFQVNVLIQFLVSSTCFEKSRVHHQEDHLSMLFFYRVFIVRLCRQSGSLVFHLLDCLHKYVKSIP